MCNCLSFFSGDARARVVINVSKIKQWKRLGNGLEGSRETTGNGLENLGNVLEISGKDLGTVLEDLGKITWERYWRPRERLGNVLETSGNNLGTVLGDSGNSLRKSYG
ncbi:unnamed protein product [Rhizophagus irregularis]|nr:unnamed protein product [Rhizophagus irregularis]